MVADFLDLENQIGRRFREDSVTDILIASLLKIGVRDATVLVPPEVKTDGDFDIVLFEPETRDRVQYRIQAKRLLPNFVHWERSSYHELDHPHGSGRQTSTLIRSSAAERTPTVALYAFYNPQSVCVASDGALAGIQLAGGRKVSTIVKALVRAKAKGKRPRWKRLEYLRHLFFPLSTVLCPPANAGTTAVFLPARLSWQAVEDAIQARREVAREMKDDPPILRIQSSQSRRLQAAAGNEEGPSKVSIDRGMRDLPSVIARAVSRRPEEPQIQTARVIRPKLILISRGHARTG